MANLWGNVKKDHKMLEFMATIGLAIMANIRKMVKMAAIAWPHVCKNMANLLRMAKLQISSENGIKKYAFYKKLWPKKIWFEIMAISFVF